MMRIRLVLLMTLTCVLSGACQKNEGPVSEKKILFVGNSLTYTNNLPDLLAGIGKAKGLTISTKILAFPNYALEDHWDEGHLQDLIATEKFDFVIVQQGPSSQPDGRDMLLE